jgi:nicotinate-nucleotide adenylyltransferase
MPDSLPVRLTRARNVARDRRILVTDVEARMGTRFTVDSLAALQKRFTQVDFVWLMGSDNLAQFSRWRRWQQIVARAPIAVVRRPGSVLASLHAPLARRIGVSRRLGPAPSLVVLDGPRSMESSTRLRELALGAAAEAVLNLVP